MLSMKHIILKKIFKFYTKYLNNLNVIIINLYTYIFLSHNFYQILM